MKEGQRGKKEREKVARKSESCRNGKRMTRNVETEEQKNNNREERGMDRQTRRRNEIA